MSEGSVVQVGRLPPGVRAGVALRCGVFGAGDGLAKESGVVRLQLHGVQGKLLEGGKESVLALVLARGVSGGGMGVLCGTGCVCGGEGVICSADMVVPVDGSRVSKDQSPKLVWGGGSEVCFL
jgi:hypothetical protein